MAQLFSNLWQSWRSLSEAETPHFSDTNFASSEIAENIELWLDEKEQEALDLLQCYVQRCIQARSGWTYVIGMCASSVFAGGSQQGFEYSSDGYPGTALLSAYVSALAMQRLVEKGAWLHFKGGTVFVDAIAKWSRQEIISDSFMPFYQVEENSSQKIQLRIKPGTENEWIYHYKEDLGDRVFYSDRSGRWARKADVFLGLVGDNEEHEGKLRFVQVAASQ
jgi:hypothetical protein